MGAGSKAALVILRIWELICSVIVLAILARFLYLVGDAGASRDGRIIYGVVVASISTFFSLFFILPFMYAFLAFPFDFALFVMWLVLFCLLMTRTGVHTCSAGWYYNYWGYYWGWWVGPGVWALGGCGRWRTVLAFSFMAMFTFLVTSILGAVVVATYYGKDRKERRAGTAGDPQTSQVGSTAPVGGPATAAPGTAAPGTQPAQPGAYA